MVNYMEISDIKIRKLSNDGKMRAVVSVTFDNQFVVHDIKIIQAQDKTFVAMPSRKSADGDFMDVAHPINADIRQKLNDAVIAEFEKAQANPDAYNR